MKYSVAVCYLTHNHVEALSEVLGRCQQLYAGYEIDICIFDDSDDNSTKDLISDLVEHGATNLFYIDVHGVSGSDEKYLKVISGYGLPKDYDYIWPSKDRVCFDEKFISWLRPAIEDGHDVIVGAYEYARWDVGENLNVDVYDDPVEFYRLYNVVCTNWECLIRKRKTMLIPIDWDRYAASYNLTDQNGFNQTVSLFTRLSEMDKCSIRICRYTDERFISDKAESTWGYKIYKVWIEMWVAANFSLPAVYDKYKAEAIKSQTNLSELFGSVEGMISLNKEGVFTKEAFEKYLSIWPFVSNIPIDRLKTIANGNDRDAMLETINDFEQAFTDHDFKKAWWLISANHYYSEHYDNRTYRILVGCFNQYRQDMMQTGSSDVFRGISSVNDLLERYHWVQ